MSAKTRWLLSAAIAVAARPSIAADLAFPALPSLAPPWLQAKTGPTGADTIGHAGDAAEVVTVPHDEARCLAQAIYYEAATEPRAGQEAVAQVVLNRVRHPLYPKSICGVVYQGARRSTGCQFTFTCDGSLTRVPVARLWKEAEEVAARAMAGFVALGMTEALNYHADYVAPRWRMGLVKIAQIGAHIFYRPRPGGEPEGRIGEAPDATPLAALARGARAAGISVWGITIATVGRGGAIRSVLPAPPAPAMRPPAEAVAAGTARSAG